MAGELKEIISESKTMPIEINGTHIDIGKLSLKKTALLILKFQELMKTNPQATGELKKSKRNGMLEILSALATLPEKDTYEILAIITEQPVEFFVGLGIDDISDIIAIVFELNNVPKIIKNLLRVAVASNPKTPEAQAN